MSSSGDDYSASDAVEDGSEGVQNEGVAGYAQQSVIGGALSALGVAISGLILGFESAFFAPVRAFTDGLSTFITGTFGGPIIVTDAGAQQSADSFTEGAAAALGPLAFPVAVGVSVLGMMIFLWFISNNSLSPLTVFTDEDR